MNTNKAWPFVILLVYSCLPGIPAFAQSANDVCPRPAPGSTVQDPPEAVKDRQGIVRLTARNSGSGPEDEAAPNYDYRFCLLGDDRADVQGPVIRASPGEKIGIRLSNRLQAFPGYPETHLMPAKGEKLCAHQPASLAADIALTNLHFHGLNISPTCGGDEVINTVVAPPGKGNTSEFDYSIHIPGNEPPGMYWYHPHIHGISQQQLLGGMPGVIIISGMEKFYPETANLRERIFILRDSDKPNPADNPNAPSDEPWKDVSINYVPVKWSASNSRPLPKIEINAGERQFWRIANAAADTAFVLKLQYRYGPNAPWQDQPLEIVARDGVPLTDDDGSARVRAHVQQQAVLPPGARIEFVMTGPPAGAEARLHSDDYNAYLLATNPLPGRVDETDRQPARTLAQLQVTGSAPRQVAAPLAASPSQRLQRFTALRKADAPRQRRLYFSKDPGDNGRFFVTVDGNLPRPFEMDAPPDIVVNMPAVEEWTIENRDTESHVFHIHQIHFRVVEINGVPTDDDSATTLLDTVALPACRNWGNIDPDDAYDHDRHFTGRNCREPYRVKLRMDFRDKDIAGTFLYHCHILEHEDNGMMAKIQAVWNPAAAAAEQSGLRRVAQGAIQARAARIAPRREQQRWTSRTKLQPEAMRPVLARPGAGQAPESP